MGRVQARVVFHCAPLSLYEMPSVVHRGSPLQVPGDADNAAGSKVGAGAAAGSAADQDRAGDHGHLLGHHPPNPQSASAMAIGTMSISLP